MNASIVVLALLCILVVSAPAHSPIEKTNILIVFDHTKNCNEIEVFLSCY